jgi:hypothetical protein
VNGRFIKPSLPYLCLDDNLRLPVNILEGARRERPDFDNRCEEQLRAGRQGPRWSSTTPTSLSRRRRCSSQIAVYSVTTSSTPSHVGYGTMVSGPSGLVAFGNVLKCAITGSGTFSLS